MEPELIDENDLKWFIEASEACCHPVHEDEDRDVDWEIVMDEIELRSWYKCLSEDAADDQERQAIAGELRAARKLMKDIHVLFLTWENGAMGTIPLMTRRDADYCKNWILQRYDAAAFPDLHR